MRPYTLQCSCMTTKYNHPHHPFYPSPFLTKHHLPTLINEKQATETHNMQKCNIIKINHFRKSPQNHFLNHSKHRGR